MKKTNGTAHGTSAHHVADESTAAQLTKSTKADCGVGRKLAPNVRPAVLINIIATHSHPQDINGALHAGPDH